MPAIMIQTKDQRTYYTGEDNLSFAREFGRTFDARVERVEVDPQFILSLDDLIAAVCDDAYVSPTVEATKRSRSRRVAAVS